jgi:hypothetical protein
MAGAGANVILQFVHDSPSRWYLLLYAPEIGLQSDQ